ncbi:DUF305 domain-containing protein [Phormidium yuhuli AB48]|uniref:DUF305 domain-containing protein n=1 Tax=Phormidium yuhuli AB48 TaxID=2940671 RepID=A0ABY5APZ7_9CYAN|nr:DUF305 domain-containing protein [Phormidium yuhuli]USR90895.1 DUF305 domain-containing protein [Phormidium yuhuli AB48]
MKLFNQFTRTGLGLTAALTLGLAGCNVAEDADSPMADGGPMTEESQEMSPEDPMATEPGQGMDHGQDPAMSGEAMGDPMDGQGMHMAAMYLGPADDEFELRFLDAMIIHHEGAIDMAEEALEKSEREEVRQLSQEIIESQEDEIAQMEQWRDEWHADAPEERQMYDAQMSQTVEMDETTKSAMQMDMELGGADEDFDLRYINAMIAHHEGALDMARQAMENSDEPELQAFAQTVIETQTAEIQEMLALRDSWYMGADG